MGGLTEELFDGLALFLFQEGEVGHLLQVCYVQKQF